MTADAKVGLLLGLFFIVIIAFLVNGLPNFIEQERTSPPAASIPTPTAEDIVLDNRISETVHRLYPSRVQPRPAESPAEGTVPQPAAEAVVVAQAPPAVVELPAQTPVVIQTDQLTTPVARPVPTQKSKSHVVATGENLALIAQKYYGAEQGNRRVVIQKLYEANSGVLKSPDRVCVGDKLIIPPLETLSAPERVVKAPDPAKGLLDKFGDMLESVKQPQPKAQAEYIIQPGDNLWKIAEEMLGDGKRHKEIQQFNKSTISGPDDLQVGMRILIPPK